MAQDSTTRNIMASIKKPTTYDELSKLVRVRSEDPFYLATALAALVNSGRLQIWETMSSYTLSTPAYAPAGMKRPRDWHQPKRKPS